MSTSLTSCSATRFFLPLAPHLFHGYKRRWLVERNHHSFFLPPLPSRPQKPWIIRNPAQNPVFSFFFPFPFSFFNDRPKRRRFSYLSMEIIKFYNTRWNLVVKKDKRPNVITGEKANGICRFPRTGRGEKHDRQRSRRIVKGGSFRRHRGEEAKRNGELQRDEVGGGGWG